jgi:hypothetical protein
VIDKRVSNALVKDAEPDFEALSAVAGGMEICDPRPHNDYGSTCALVLRPERLSPRYRKGLNWKVKVMNINEDQTRQVAQPWKVSQYYERAEREDWMRVF